MLFQVLLSCFEKNYIKGKQAGNVICYISFSVIYLLKKINAIACRGLVIILLPVNRI
jgi:hypothetical protein